MNKKIVLSISGMHCVSCGMNIDGELEDTEGVVSATTNYASSKSVVEFDEEKISSKKIADTIASLGYVAKEAA